MLSAFSPSKGCVCELLSCKGSVVMKRMFVCAVTKYSSLLKQIAGKVVRFKLNEKCKLAKSQGFSTANNYRRHFQMTQFHFFDHLQSLWKKNPFIFAFLCSLPRSDTSRYEMENY